MTRVTPLLGSLKIYTITFKQPPETLLSTPETLPTSEPATPQVGFTLAAEKFPEFNLKPYSIKYVGVVYAAGKFTTGGTLSWRMKKNGVSVNTGSQAVSANNFYTVNAFFLDVAPGDLLELALWSSVSDSNWDYKAYFICATRFLPFNFSGNSRLVMANVVFSNTSDRIPTLTLGNPTRGFDSYPYIFFMEGGSGYYTYWGVTGTLLLRCLVPHSIYGCWRVMRYGDSENANTAVVYTDTVYRPKYWSSRLNITSMFRLLRLD